MLNQFLSNVYSEELFAGISEADYAEVTSASAVDDGWQGYAEWSTELEQGEVIETQHGAILMNRDCNHAACKSTRCDKDTRIGGISI